MPLQTRKISATTLWVAVLLCTLSLSGCNPTQVQSAGVRAGSDGTSPALVGKGYVYESDPITLTRNANLPATVNMGKLVSSTPRDIAPGTKATLTNDCNFVQTKYPTDFSFSDPATRQFVDCLKVKESDDPTLTPIAPVGGSWVFRANSPEFYQVNAMYQLNTLTQRMLEVMSFIHTNLHVNNTVKSLPPAVPYFLGDMGTWWYKYHASTSLMTKSAQLTVQSGANIKNNAFYDPINNQILLGYLTDGVSETNRNGALTVQDPTTLYHELGHSFMTIFLNMRNAELVSGSWRAIPYQAFPLYGSYDELNSVGEGIADYFSYFMTGSTTFGQWAFGRFLNLSRPITEENPIHAPGISSAVDERLSYPELILYYPQKPDKPVEDVHNTGMVISHYLVALTESFKSECFMDQEMATKHVMLLLAESLAFLGDLTGRGTDYNNTNDGTGKPKALVNLHRNAAYTWYYGSRRLTMRRFIQTFAKNIYHVMGRNICPGFTKEESEQLLDMYGLLLFNNYDDNGTFSATLSDKSSRQDAFVINSALGLKNSRVNSIAASQFNGSYFTPDLTFPFTTAPTPVNEANRIKSVLVPKSALTINSAGINATLRLDDRQVYAQDVVSNTLFEGRIITPSFGIAGPEYNNNNRRVSPGEIVGLIVNLENKSSIPIGGVEVLATPWAHMKVLPDPVPSSPTFGLPSWRSQPCSINGFPSTAEGGLPATDCTDASILPEDGRRFKRPSVATNWPSKALHPVCLAQTSANNETRWVSQDEYRRNVLQLEDKDCLGFGTPDFTPSECLMRFFPGRDAAFLSKIDPAKSYIDTVFNPDLESRITNSAGLTLEVNKWIPPGTKFTCRLRLQFSNCADCFQSGPGQDEYTDIEYGGHKPFKVLDVPLTILD